MGKSKLSVKVSGHLLWRPALLRPGKVQKLMCSVACPSLFDAPDKPRRYAQKFEPESTELVPDKECREVKKARPFQPKDFKSAMDLFIQALQALITLDEVRTSIPASTKEND